MARKKKTETPVDPPESLVRIAYAAWREEVLWNFADYPPHDVSDVRPWDFLIDRDRKTVIEKARGVMAGTVKPENRAERLFAACLRAMVSEVGA